MPGLVRLIQLSALFCLLTAQVVKVTGQYEDKDPDNDNVPGGFFSRLELQPEGYFLPWDEDIAAAEYEQEMAALNDGDGYGDSRARKKGKGAKGRQDASGCLQVHNMLRALHNVPDLQWDSKLADFAKKRSEHMARTGKFQHEPGTPYGENLYMISGTGTGCSAMVKMWYNEIKMYNFGSPTWSLSTGHFTQIVWKGSKRLGCGFATGARGLYLTCNYDPPGNRMGQFQQNVLPKCNARNGKCRGGRKRRAIGGGRSDDYDDGRSGSGSGSDDEEEPTYNNPPNGKYWLNGRTRVGARVRPSRRPPHSRREPDNWLKDIWVYCLSGHCRPRTPQG